MSLLSPRADALSPPYRDAKALGHEDDFYASTLSVFFSKLPEIARYPDDVKVALLPLRMTRN